MSSKAVNARAAVVVGVGQLKRRPVPADGSEGTGLDSLPEPVDMMAEVLREAARDSGGGEPFLRAAESVRVVDVLSWKYANAALLLAERLGIDARELVVTTTGGNSPQMLVNDAALSISRGELDVALVVGAEAMFTRLAVMKPETKTWLAWTRQPDGTPAPRVMGSPRQGNNDVEMSHSLLLPSFMYPIFENALRASTGEGIDEHQERVASLWSRFSEVAASNPYAWQPRTVSPDEISTPTASNRMVAFPYPKLMNANIQTDQAAGLIVCSVAAARRYGIPKDRWVFVRSGSEAEDHWYVSERADLHSSPAIRIAGRRVFSLAGITNDDVAHIDLYSCFPSAVQIASKELGFGLDDPDRPLTVTGGLGFAGGPGSNYSTHAIAAMVGRLRNDPGGFGLVTSLGWFITKHALAIYSTSPPPDGFRYESPQAQISALPKRELARSYEGTGEIESYTVTYDRDGTESSAVVACLLPDGRRAWGSVRGDIISEMTTSEQCGRKARFLEDGSAELL